MWWRLPRGEFERKKGAGNKRRMKRLVESGPSPGILAYHGDEAVGWCAVAPRATYPGLARSRVLKPVDERPVWSITCLFVRKDWRNRGVSATLLAAAADHVRAHGGTIVEGYPVQPAAGRMADAFAWTGLPSAFTRAGFREVARRSPARPIMRRVVARAGGAGGTNVRGEPEQS